MRIAHVANFYGPRSGGLRTAMHALGAGYEAAGHTSVLVVPADRESREQTPFGVRISLPGREVPGTGGYRVITDRNAVHRILDEVAPDRLEVSDRTTLRWLGEWARTQRVPSLLWAHERVDGVLQSILPDGAGSRTVARRLADGHNRATARRFDRIVCTTAFAAEEFHRIRAGNVVRVPLGVDLEEFSPGYHNPVLRRELARQDEALVVLCSRLSPEKRPELAVRAIEVLHRRGIPVRLVVAGTGPREEAVRQASVGLPVTMLGFVADRPRLSGLLATADAVIAPGPIETFGLAALEALASGTPVVASSTSALAEIVTTDAGVVTDPTAVALADGLVEVMSRDPEARRRSARARAEQLPWSRTVAAVLALHQAPLRRVPDTDLAPTRSAALVRASYARTLPARATRQDGPGNGPRVLGLGDSVTVGVGDLVAPGHRPGWAAHVARAVDAAHFANLARLGARARTVVDEQLRTAVAQRPDLALLCVGGNDVLRGDLDPADVAACIRQCVHELLGVGCHVVLVRVPSAAHVSWLPTAVRRVLDDRVALVNNGLDDVVAETAIHALTLDSREPTHPQLWHVDRIHPGPVGHRLLAQRTLAEVVPRGIVAVESVPPLTMRPPSRPAQLGWLLRNGTPWLVKRSVDLGPALRRQMTAC
jgi:alpha-1,6-mannosyltransferase